jgi:hypothetical protein
MSTAAKAFSITPPIRAISVHKNKVLITDNVGNQKVSFNTGPETKQFLRWLNKTFF